MIEIALVLHPNAHRNRSMQLYAQRLAALAPTDQHWRIVSLPGVGGRIGTWASEIAVPPPCMALLRADVVHIVDHAHASYLHYFRGPSVVTVHDLIPLKLGAGEFPDQPSRLTPSLLWFRWNAAALRSATRLVCPSQASAKELERLMGLAADVVPNGIEPVFFTPAATAAAARIAARLPDRSRPVMLQVSTGFFYKNDSAFLSVFTRLASSRPELLAVRVGSPLPASARAELEARGLSDRFLDFGRASVEDLKALYRRASVLLFPSLDEGFGWPPLEAMAAGCPVVASNAGALRETVAEHGFVASPGDIDTLVAHVTRVLDEGPALQGRLLAARAFAQSFSWQRTADQLARIYREVLQ